MAEHRSPKPVVGGSNPSWPAMLQRDYSQERCFSRMNKLFSFFQAVKIFSTDVTGEVIKSSWPSRQELIESTIVIIISVILLALFIGVSDKMLFILLKLLIPARGY